MVMLLFPYSKPNIEYICTKTNNKQQVFLKWKNKHRNYMLKIVDINKHENRYQRNNCKL